LDITWNDDNFIQEAVEKYSDMVIRIAFQNLKNMPDAEDVAQEVFIKLMKLPAYNSNEHLKAWIIRVTINQCKDLKKSFWNRKTQALIDQDQLFTEEQKGVMEELWKLPENYRNTVYLYYYEEYTIPEIANLLNKKVNTVSSWLRRAKIKLRDILMEREFDYEK